MPIADEDIIEIKSEPISRTEALFAVEVFKGLGTTLKHLVGAVSGAESFKTMQYPEERREHQHVEDGGLFRDYFRGVHRLNRDEDGRVRCVACFMCATACPANCIHIEGEEAPWDDREKYPRKFDIDELRCIYCGMCEEACPVDAIELTPVYDIVGLTRQEMIFDKEKLLAVYDETIEDKPM